MAIKTAIIHDESGFAPLTILGVICDVVKDEKCNAKNRIQKWNTNREGFCNMQ